MAITFPYGMPTSPGIREIEWLFSGNTAFTESTFTRQRQHFRFPGDLLRAKVTMPKMARDEAADFAAWGAALRGRYGTFLLGPVEKTPRGTATGTPLVQGGGQTGDSLVIDGCTPGITFLKAGDWFHVWEDKAVLHMVLKDAAADGFGVVTLDVFPRIRIAPADNAALQVHSPQGTFRMDDDTFSQKTELFMISNYQFGIVEAV